MSMLGRAVDPWVSHQLHSRDPFIDSLVVAFDIGLDYFHHTPSFLVGAILLRAVLT